MATLTPVPSQVAVDDGAKSVSVVWKHWFQLLQTIINGMPINNTPAGWTMTNEGGVVTPVGRTKVAFSCTGALQSFVAPTTGYIYVKLWGAGGGGGCQGGWTEPGVGGAGGHTRGFIPVVAGQTYYIVVGSGGQCEWPAGVALCYGGGGGLFNNLDNRYSGSGGGYAGIFSTSALTQAVCLMIAGGGGGGGSSITQAQNGCTGGAGGGPMAEQGGQPSQVIAYYGGGGGTQVAGGASLAQVGNVLYGGYGGGYGGFSNGYGGGGGGGYFGGGGGAYNGANIMGGGGGGSGFTAASVINPGNFTGCGAEPAFYWDADLPKTTDNYHISSKYAHGGDVFYNGTANAASNMFGGCGYCVIYY